MSRADELMKLRSDVYGSIMVICEDAMDDDNELEALAAKMQLAFEKIVRERYGYKD